MSEETTAYRKKLRKKLVRLFFEEYRRRKEQGVLFFEGRWITPDEKMDFFEDLRREHRRMWNDSLLLIGIGFVLALILILIMKNFLFPK